mmetsp:Transcript_28586/g.57117  ORF Transcript_28586/g.57117 Transcript_28586/m.57117 type:complete len:230 (-) Transcript_28586:168-857(-)
MISVNDITTFLNTLNIFSLLRINLNTRSLLHESRNTNSSTTTQLGRLGVSLSGISLDVGLGLDDLEDVGAGNANLDDFAFEEDEVALHSFRDPFLLVFDDLGFDHDFFKRFGIHEEVVSGIILVSILTGLPQNLRGLEFLPAPVSILDGIPPLQVLKLDRRLSRSARLFHDAEGEDFVGFPIGKFDGESVFDVGGVDCHGEGGGKRAGTVDGSGSGGGGEGSGGGEEGG